MSFVTFGAKESIAIGGGTVIDAHVPSELVEHFPGTEKPVFRGGRNFYMVPIEKPWNGSGEKLKALHSLRTVANDLRGKEDLGGGLIFTCRALAASLRKKSTLFAIDENASPLMVSEQFAKFGVKHHSLGLAEMPTNIVVLDRGDRTILKSPRQERNPFDRECARRVCAVLKGVSAIVLNSLKSPELVRCILNSLEGRRLFTVLTPSFSTQDIPQLRSLGVVILGHEDTPLLSEWVSRPPMGRPEQLIAESHRGAFRHLHHPIFVTFGGHGVVGLLPLGQVFWLRPGKRLSEEAQTSMARIGTQSVNGRGDAWAGYLVAAALKYPRERVDWLAAARFASSQVLCHMGIERIVGNDEFELSMFQEREAA